MYLVLVELWVFGKMIKRVRHIEEFQKYFDNWLTNQEEWNKEFFATNKFSKFGIPFDVQCLRSYWSNQVQLNNCYILINTTNDILDGFIWWVMGLDEKINKKVFTEYIWFSNNPKISIKLFKESVKYAKENKFDIISVGNINDNSKLKKFYKKNGFNFNTDYRYKIIDMP